jgi:hypothetical protein
MSSIAYTTDQEMIEYHRLCGNRDVNFWRLSARAGFTDFKRGDLLFFYAYGQSKRKKGFVGYAHFESTSRLSLNEMWKRYGTANGYSSKERLKEAIELASRTGAVPDTMNCLHLKDCVYFSDPVYPKEAGLSINEKLESFTYLDRNDPTATLRILRIAEKRGIDIWARSQNYEPDSVFELDEVRQQLSLISEKLAPEDRSQTELRKARKLIRPLLQEGEAEKIRGTEADAFFVRDGKVTIIVPFAAQVSDRQKRIQELLGKLVIYKTAAEAEELRGGKPEFRIICEEEEETKEFLLNAVNHV